MISPTIARCRTANLGMHPLRRRDHEQVERWRVLGFVAMTLSVQERFLRKRDNRTASKRGSGVGKYPLAAIGQIRHQQKVSTRRESNSVIADLSLTNVSVSHIHKVVALAGYFRRKRTAHDERRFLSPLGFHRRRFNASHQVHGIHVENLRQVIRPGELSAHLHQFGHDLRHGSREIPQLPAILVLDFLDGRSGWSA